MVSLAFSDSEGPVQLELPEQWLWDIIDEFIYQYQVFCTWRSKVKSKTDDELQMLAEGGPVSTLSIASAHRSPWNIGLELLQRPQRPILSHAEIQNQRVYRCTKRGKIPRRNRVSRSPSFHSRFSDSVNSEIVGEYGQRPLYRMLGYFSIIGLLRVHVLLGDYTLALKVMENVELNQKVPIIIVILV